MIEVTVLQVEQCLSIQDDVALMDGCRLRRCRDGASEIVGYVCTSHSSKELAEIVSIVSNRTIFLLGLQVGFVELISGVINNRESIMTWSNDVNDDLSLTYLSNLTQCNVVWLSCLAT